MHHSGDLSALARKLRPVVGVSENSPEPHSRTGVRFGSQCLASQDHRPGHPLRTIDDREPSTILARVLAWRGFRNWFLGGVSTSDANVKSGVHNLTLPDFDLREGAPVGEYVVVSKLGEGGFGTVYEVAHPLIGKRAAVKILHAQYSANPGITARFVAEARAVNQIRHRNIVDIFSFGDLPDGRHYYVMEFLEGVPLDAYLEKAGCLPLDEALGLLGPIAKAITAAHEAGIIHRDLKPENVFLELDDEGHVHPKILDFGMAKLLSEPGSTVSQTRSGAPIGSPRYMSPEQCRGVAIDERTDVYAFGCIAYRMLVGGPPFEAATVLELMMAQVSLPPAIPSTRCPSLDIALDQPLLRMLEKQPENRPATAWLAYESLTKALPKNSDFSLATVVSSPLLRSLGEERKAKRPSLPTRQHTSARHPTSSKRPFTIASAVGWMVLAALVVLIGVMAGWFRQPQRAPRLSPTTESPLASVQPPASATTEPPIAEPEPPPASSVQVTIHAEPAQAELFWEDERLGIKDATVAVPIDGTPKNLTVKAPGYTTTKVPVVPSADVTVKVKLVPLPRAVRPNTDVPHDLEDPYRAP